MQKICLHVECISTKKSYFSRNQSRKGVMKKQFLDLILLLRNWSCQFWCQNSSYNSVNFGAKIQNWDTFCHCFSTLWCGFVCIKNPFNKSAPVTLLLWLNDFRASTTFLRPPYSICFSCPWWGLTWPLHFVVATRLTLPTLAPSPPLSDVFTRVSHFSPNN